MMRNFKHGAATVEEAFYELEADNAMTVQELLELLQTIPLEMRMVSYVWLPTGSSFDGTWGDLTRRGMYYDKSNLRLNLEGDECAKNHSR